MCHAKVPLRHTPKDSFEVLGVFTAGEINLQASALNLL